MPEQREAKSLCSKRGKDAVFRVEDLQSLSKSPAAFSQHTEVCDRVEEIPAAVVRPVRKAWPRPSRGGPRGAISPNAP